MPHRRTTPAILDNARQLRQSQTDAEAKLWQHLRSHQLLGAHFRRQHALGSYIADFCAPSQRLIIEVDGSQHLEQAAYDAERTAFFASKGYRVLRFWNTDVLNNIESVLLVISQAIEES